MARARGPQAAAHERDGVRGPLAGGHAHLARGHLDLGATARGHVVAHAPQREVGAEGAHLRREADHRQGAVHVAGERLQPQHVPGHGGPQHAQPLAPPEHADAVQLEVEGGVAHDRLLQRHLDGGNAPFGGLAEELEGDVQAARIHPAHGSLALVPQLPDEVGDGGAHVLGEFAGDEQAVALLRRFAHGGVPHRRARAFAPATAAAAPASSPRSARRSSAPGRRRGKSEPKRTRSRPAASTRRATAAGS